MNIKYLNIILCLFFFSATSCSILNVDDLNATSEARIAATPKASPQRTMTNLSGALQCMDDLFVRYNISDLLIGAQDVLDPTAKARVPTKDMLISALSAMSKRSKAVRFVVLGYDLQDISTYHNLHKDKAFNVPDFFIRISPPQFDKGVSSERVGGGFRLQDLLSFEANQDRMLSIASLDMNLGVTKTLQIIPGMTSSNSIAVARKGNAMDFSGTLKKMGALFQISFDTSEGMNHSLRTLVDLGAIELIGSLTQVPYWECLDIENTNPEVQSKVYEWYAALTTQELRVFAQSKLEAIGFYKGAVNGKDNNTFRQAVVNYKESIGLIANSSLNFAVYYQLMTDQTPIKSDYLSLLTQRIKDPEDFEDSEDAEIRDIAMLQNVSILNTGVKPLQLNLSTNRGIAPVFNVGELMSIRASVSTDAYMYCYYHQGDGKILKIFPNSYAENPEIKADEMLFIPGGNFRLRPELEDSEEQVMCIASYNEIDQSLPEELSARSLQAVPVDNLDSVYQYYKMVSNVVPLRKTINIQIR